MGIVVNPLRGRLGCKIYWRLLVPYWGDGREAKVQRLSVYIVGLFLWMFRFITHISQKRLRLFMIEWTSAVVSFRGDVLIMYLELFDYENYRRMVQNVVYDRWLKRNVVLLRTLRTISRNHGGAAIMMQNAVNRIFWLIRRRLLMAEYHGSFRVYMRFMFETFRGVFSKLADQFGMSRILLKLMPIVPMKWTTAHLIGIWCLKKVDEGFKPNRILSRVVAGCKNIKGLEGFKICLTGRFTRRQASTYSWLTGGQSGSGFFIDRAQFATVAGVSPFGSCSVKIWLRYV